MAQFTHKPQEPSAWAALPGEPLDEPAPSERLDHAPAVDPMTLGLDTVYTSVAVPVPDPDPAESTEPGQP